MILVSTSFYVSADDPVGLTEAVRRAVAGEVVHVVRDGQPVPDIVPPTPTPTGPQDSSWRSSDVSTGAAEPRVRTLPLGAASASDPCQLDARAMATLEARMASRPPAELHAGRIHAERFGAPTLAHYRAVYLQAGAPWPGTEFVRRHHPVADPE